MSANRPLSGIRVIDASRIVAGPTCCFWLASLGAEVIRVEAPDGDMGWRTYPRVGPDGDHDGPLGDRDIPMSPLRKHRGKRSVVLDLTIEPGRDVFRQLIAVSDVVVENMKPGTMQSWGLGWDALSAINPRLVYACITGYGVDGPYRDKPAMDPIVQAVSGLMARTGEPDGPPTRVGMTVGDQLPGVWAALGVLAALRQRDHDGQGQFVDVAMLDALLAMSWDDPLDLYEDQGLPERFGGGDPRGGPFGVYRARDGWVAIAAPADGLWERMARLIGGEALDEKWRVHRTRAERRDEIDAIMNEWCQPQLTSDIVAVLERERIPVGPVNPPWWARHDEHVRHRGSLERLRHPDRTEPTAWLGPRIPVHFSRASTETTPAEPLGASTEPVMRDVLGLDPAEVAALREAGAFGKPSP